MIKKIEDKSLKKTKKWSKQLHKSTPRIKIKLQKNDENQVHQKQRVCRLRALEQKHRLCVL